MVMILNGGNRRECRPKDTKRREVPEGLPMQQYRVFLAGMREQLAALAGKLRRRKTR